MEPSTSRQHELSDPSMREIKAWINSYGSWPDLRETVRKSIAAEAARGDKYAREQMLQFNLRLVLSRALRKVGRGVPLADLFQEGVLGLMRAIEKYDPKRGTQFSSMAAWWIDLALRDAINTQGRAIVLPRDAVDRLSRIAAATSKSQPIRELDQRWLDKLAREVSGDASLAGVTLEQVDVILSRPASIHRPVNSDNTKGEDVGTLGDTLAAEPERDPIGGLDIEALLLRLVNSGAISRRDGWVVVRHFGLDGDGGRSYGEVAKELSAASKVRVSRQRIEQMVKRVVRIMRANVLAQEGGDWTKSTKRDILIEQAKGPVGASLANQSKNTTSPKKQPTRRTSDLSRVTASRLATPVSTSVQHHSNTKTGEGSRSTSDGLGEPYREAI